MNANTLSLVGFRARLLAGGWLVLAFALVCAFAPSNALADPAAPTVQSVSQNGQNLTSATESGGLEFYTNDSSDPVTVTVAGDPNASQISLSCAGYSQATPPDSNGDATFNVADPTECQGALAVQQTVNGVAAGNGNAATLNVNEAPDVINPEDVLDDPDTVDYHALQLIPGEPFELFVDGQKVLTATANSAGLIGGLATTQLASPGYHTMYVKSVDAQGFESQQSNTLGFYVRPFAPTVSSPSLTPDVYTFVNQSVPTLAVSGVDAGATVDVSQFTDEGIAGPVLGSATNTGGDGATVDVTLSNPLPDGFDSLAVIQTIVEGTGATTESVMSWPAGADLQVDTAAPTIAYSPTPSGDQPTISFNVTVFDDTSAEVKLVDADTGQTLGVVPFLQGYWTPSGPLPDGHYSVYAVTVDNTGNVSTAQSNTVQFDVTSAAAKRLAARVNSVGHPNAQQLLAHGQKVRVYCSRACSLNVGLQVYYRSARSSLHVQKFAALKAILRSGRTPRPWTHANIGHVTVRLSHAGYRTVTVRVAKAERTAVRSAAAVLLGVYMHDGNRLLSKHWTREKGPTPTAMLRALNALR